MWQPIDTAPEDVNILGYDPKSPEFGWIAVISRCGDGFSVIHDREDYAWSNFAPTHWMPLPKPPQ